MSSSSSSSKDPREGGPPSRRSRRSTSSCPRRRARSSASTASRLAGPSLSRVGAGTLGGDGGTALPLGGTAALAGAAADFAVSSPGRGIFLSGVPGGRVAFGLAPRSGGVVGRVVRRAPQPGQMRKPPGSGAAVMGFRHFGHCMEPRSIK